MSQHALPLGTLRVPDELKHAAERGRIALYLSGWLTVPTAAWLVFNDEVRLAAYGVVGVALMPLVLQVVLLPAQLLARRRGRAQLLAAAAITAASLAAWTWAAAVPVLEREHLSFTLRLLWAYCVAVLPLALMASQDEDAFTVFAGAAQVQLGVLGLAFAQAATMPPAARLAGLAALAAGSTWAVHGVWQQAHHPPK